jgi:hypothetical protein
MHACFFVAVAQPRRTRTLHTPSSVIDTLAPQRAPPATTKPTNQPTQGNDPADSSSLADKTLAAAAERTTAPTTHDVITPPSPAATARDRAEDASATAGEALAGAGATADQAATTAARDAIAGAAGAVGAAGAAAQEAARHPREVARDVVESVREGFKVSQRVLNGS